MSSACPSSLGHLLTLECLLQAFKLARRYAIGFWNQGIRNLRMNLVVSVAVWVGYCVIVRSWAEGNRYVLKTCCVVSMLHLGCSIFHDSDKKSVFVTTS